MDIPLKPSTQKQIRAAIQTCLDKHQWQKAALLCQHQELTRSPVNRPFVTWVVLQILNAHTNNWYHYNWIIRDILNVDMDQIVQHFLKRRQYTAIMEYMGQHQPSKSNPSFLTYVVHPTIKLATLIEIVKRYYYHPTVAKYIYPLVKDIMTVEDMIAIHKHCLSSSGTHPLDASMDTFNFVLTTQEFKRLVTCSIKRLITNHYKRLKQAGTVGWVINEDTAYTNTLSMFESLVWIGRRHTVATQDDHAWWVDYVGDMASADCSIDRLELTLLLLTASR